MSRLLGHLDEVDRGWIRGWALDPGAPQQRLILDLFINGRFAGQVLANQQRNDLRDAGIGDGYHGFEWRDSGLVGSDAIARVSIEAPRIGGWRRGRVPAPGTLGERVFAKATDYLQALLARLPERPASATETETAKRAGCSPLHARLLAPADPNPASLCHGQAISAYQSYVMHRFRQESDFDPAFSLGEYRRFLRWYLHHYGSVRANLRVPLSERDIAFLNRETGENPHRLEAMALFSDHFATNPGFEELEWALYNARALGFADCLNNWSFAVPEQGAAAPVTPQLVALFMRRHPVLRALDPTRPDNVAGIARVLGCLCPAPSSPPAGAVRIEAARLTVSSQQRVDVQIIGPFSKALGVGESCRRMATVLGLTGLTVRTCDFSIDYPNESLQGLPFTLEAPGPTRVNIIHLNLEEIPKIVAYWPDIFTGAINIAVPYLELSGLAPEQRLGLALVDRVFAATRHIQTVIGDSLPVDVVGAALEPAPMLGRQQARKAAFGMLCHPSDFVVLVAGDALSGLDRKNLVGAVRAFLAAFPDEANRKLVIKTHSVQRTQNSRQIRIWDDIREIAETDNRIILIDRHLDAAEYRGLQAASDCYLSLHRAEGLGYHVLECMQLDVPCIVTDYSGTCDFATPETALLVDFVLVPVKPWEYPFTRGDLAWAAPSIETASRHLRNLAEDPSLGRDIAQKARALVETEYSLAAMAARLGAILRTMPGA